MTQEEKELLFKDLCSRLPYGVKVNTIYSNEHASFYRRRACKNGVNELNLNIMWLYHVQFEIDIKPYLFPLESMTEEQKQEYNRLKYDVPVCYYEYGDLEEKVELYDSLESFEYLIKNHFDYRGLIDKGLAIDCTNLNVY